MKNKQHCTELTVMSGIAIVFVLGIHAAGRSLGAFWPDGMGYAAASVWVRILSNLTAPAVPMFLFVSGYKFALNDGGTPYFVFLRKRLPRVITSFFLINTLFWGLDCLKYMQTFDVILLAKTYLHSWVGYSVAYQLWYIPMYCVVIMLCPLVCRLVPGSGTRFAMYALIGVAQRILEVSVPVLATYPIRFISYPVFFELGILAQKNGWKSKLTSAACTCAGCVYAAVVMLISWLCPELSDNGIFRYIVYYFAGTAVYYAVSVSWENCRYLYRMGMLSYPVFLLHEPLIGGCVAAVLKRLPVGEPLFALLWLVTVLGISRLLTAAINWCRLDKILWNFCIPHTKK